MTGSPASNVMRCLRSTVLQHEGTRDGDLLDLYVRHGDAAAFEALVRRLGPMVLGVCRRVLGHSPDVEDAFQATFLVLVRRAASIQPPGMVGNWLYGVARRTALEARRAVARRRAKEAQVAPRTEAPQEAPSPWRSVLDEELARLPDRYRAVVVLCDLDGRTRRAAAQELGLPEGTVASRLGRARNLLARRLTRRGVTLAGAAAAVGVEESSWASVPPALVTATVRSAAAYAAGPAATAGIVAAPVAALAEGVLKAMIATKYKLIGVLLVLTGVAGTGLGSLVPWNPAPEPPAPRPRPPVALVRAEDPPAAREKQAPSKPADAKKPADQAPAQQILDMVKQGLDAYRMSRGKDGQRAGPAGATGDLEKYAEAFSVAFRVGNEIAKALSTGQRNKPAEAADAIDKYGPTFLKAYEHARALKQELDAQQAVGVKGGEKAREALDLFLKAGAEFERAAKQRAVARTVRQARREVERAFDRLEKTAADERTTLEHLDEIEKAVQALTKRLQEQKTGR